jgi:hypothetical protein
MIEERDSLLHESTRRFNLLKEDFQYNLTLLEARDKEIARLHYVEVQLEAVTQDKENLSKRMEMMMMKECEKEEKTQQDKITNKVRRSVFVLIILFIYSLTHSLTHSLCSFTHLLIYSFTHLLIYSFTHLLISYTHCTLMHAYTSISFTHPYHHTLLLSHECMHSHSLIHIKHLFLLEYPD